MSDETKRLLDMMQQSLNQQKLQMEQHEKLLENNAALQRDNDALRQQALSNTDRATITSTKKPDRPMVNADLDDSEWELWKDRWRRYKGMVKISTPSELRMELRASCSEEVDRLLFQYVGSSVLDIATEIELLEHIKSVAVKSTHIEVHRNFFGSLVQSDGELVTHYVARLKSHAAMCNFTIKCSCDPSSNVSYAEKMVEHQLIVGISNQEHQSRILAEAANLLKLQTLNDKVERLHILETTHESTAQMKSGSSAHSDKTSFASAGMSRYQKEKRTKSRGQGLESKKDKKLKVKKCRGCGQSNHNGKNTLERKECPAYDKICFNCGIKGHFSSNCERTKADYAGAGLDEGSGTEEGEGFSAQASGSFIFGACATQDENSEQVFRQAANQNFRR